MKKQKTDNNILIFLCFFTTISCDVIEALLSTHSDLATFVHPIENILNAAFRRNSRENFNRAVTHNLNFSFEKFLARFSANIF